MSRIPMVGDERFAPEELVDKYGDPKEVLAEAYFASEREAVAAEERGDKAEAAEHRRNKLKAVKTLAKYGFRPEMVEGKPKAVR